MAWVNAEQLANVRQVDLLAEDADIDNAELAYTEWETDLQIRMTDLQFQKLLEMVLTILRKSKSLDEAIADIEQLLDKK